VAGGAEPETTAVDVVALPDLADSLAVTIWIDGGWGVDALLRRFHTGYAVDAEDWADVAALCAAFDVPIPDDHRRFLS